MKTFLRKIQQQDLEMIMRWRMDPEITKYMNTDPKLTLEGQKKWLQKIESDDHVMYWLIETDGIPAGIICLIDIDWENKTSSWGYYIGEKKCRSLKLALSLEMSLYDFVFDKLGFQSLHNEVFSLNEGVIKLHKLCGSEIVEIREKEICKNGTYYDITHINIEKEQWARIRKDKKYEKIDFSCYTVHHIGYAVQSIEKSLSAYKGLGYRQISEICDDNTRKVKIVFIQHILSQTVIELISPLTADSPVTGQLDKMKKMASPYHICYEVDDIGESIKSFKKRGFVPIDIPESAPALDGRLVSFLLNKDVGMIELLQR